MLSIKSQASRDPEWYKTRADILKAIEQEPEDFARFIDEATQRHPSYYELYFIAIEFYAPKWHGDRQQIEAFARKAIEKTRIAEGTGLYARIYWYASQMQFGHSLFTESDVDWDTMRDGMDDVLADYPDQWNIQNFAVFACLAGDRAMTAKLMNMMDDRPIRRVWRRPENLEFCRSMSKAI